MYTLKWMLIAAMLLALGLVVSSCKPPCNPPDSLDELERPFGVSSGPPQDDKPKSINVFIDGSGSMKGYTHPGGEYYSTFKLLLSRLPSDAEIKLYRFGPNSSPLMGDFRSNLNDILSSNFYHYSTTDICSPLGIIAKDKGSINLILTDGLDTSSGASGYQVEFARSLRQHLGDKGYFSLMGKRARFQGRYFSIKEKQYIDLGNDAKRPLFCLALSNRRYADYIREKIGSLFDNTFDFGKLDNNELRYTYGKDGKTIPEGLSHSIDASRLPLTEYRLKGNGKELQFCQKNYQDSYGKVIDYRIAYKPFRDSLYKLIENKKGTVVAEEASKQNEISYNIPFDLDKKGDYLIRITYRKTLPQWISDWSTDDDSQIENQTKAYMLKEWMQYILENFGDLESLSTTQYYFYICKRR